MNTKSKMLFLKDRPLLRKISAANKNTNPNSLLSISHDTLKATKYKVANKTTSKLFLDDHKRVLLA
jgi:hypothetical protein